MRVKNPLGASYTDLELPDHTTIVHMKEPGLLEDPGRAIRAALEAPIASKPLSLIAREKRAVKPGVKAAIVVSDNTRPVPYRGEEGVLVPVLETLFAEDYAPKDISILIATGTHRGMEDEEIRAMLDPQVFAWGVRVINHDCKKDDDLVYLGDTKRGTRMLLNRHYVEADLKIATGLVESHFMAGTSGGRKAICPGIIGEESTFVFHGPELMAHPAARDLNLEGNPVHEESLEVAKRAGVDFLVNVTLNHAFHLTGIFCGDLEAAHLAAVEKVAGTVGAEVESYKDVVITHGGYVGINHYQCAKAAVGSLGILKKGGYLVLIADTTDSGNVVGGINYRTTLALLKIQGARGFVRAICSPDWTFVSEQWQVQQWAKVFDRIDQDHLLFYSPKLDALWWPGLPGMNGMVFLPEAEQKVPGANCFTKVVDGALAYIAGRTGKAIAEMDIAYMAEGPYCIPHASGDLEP